MSSVFASYSFLKKIGFEFVYIFESFIQRNSAEAKELIKEMTKSEEAMIKKSEEILKDVRRDIKRIAIESKVERKMDKMMEQRIIKEYTAKFESDIQYEKVEIDEPKRKRIMEDETE
jgi:hypothetical protein